jgi:hypothetical protein
MGGARFSGEIEDADLTTAAAVSLGNSCHDRSSVKDQDANRIHVAWICVAVGQHSDRQTAQQHVIVMKVKVGPLAQTVLHSSFAIQC